MNSIKKNYEITTGEIRLRLLETISQKQFKTGKKGEIR